MTKWSKTLWTLLASLSMVAALDSSLLDAIRPMAKRGRRARLDVQCGGDPNGAAFDVLVLWATRLA